MALSLPSFLLLIPSCLAQLKPPGTVTPLAQVCGPCSGIICINNYSAVMPYHFFRLPSNGSYEDTYASTAVPSDPSFNLVSSANFLVFDEKRGFEILGKKPNYEFVFAVNDGMFLNWNDSDTEEMLMKSSGPWSASLFAHNQQAVFLPIKGGK
jgi:hypothetical protein